MKKISEEKMASTNGGGKFWATHWQCVPYSNDAGSYCKCRKVYHRFWGKSYGDWSHHNVSCAYNGLRA